MLETSIYLPSEVANLTNYPELRAQRANLTAIMDYALRATSALADYNEARYDKIDLNAGEIRQAIALCRSTSEVLGTAPKVCFDILLEIRTVQEDLQNLLFLRVKYGTKYIGVPTITTPTGEGSVV